MSPTAKILIVDDDTELLNAVKLTIEAAGHTVVTADNGLDALQVLENQPISLIVADIAMPGVNGYQLLRRIRENPEWVPIPIIFLTARTLDSDIQFGKELGVDDYLIKPVRSLDLLASINGKLERARQWKQAMATTPIQALDDMPPPAECIEVGDLCISSEQHRVWFQGRRVALSAREFSLLEHLARHFGNVVRAEELVRITHNSDTDMVEAGSLLRPLVRSVRRKLGYPPGNLGCIENVRSVGYRLLTP